jgi:hypothetical protein
MAMTKRLGAIALGFVVPLTLAGCAAEPEGEETADSEADLSAAASRSVNLKYEGTCDFLRSCSTFSKNLPAGKVTWGCTGVGACSDSAKWVAGPNRSFCGKTVKICKGASCVNALVKAVSVSKDWEASNGVMDAIGLPHGLSGRCSGFGGGKVSISFGGTAPVTADAKEEPDTVQSDVPLPPERPDDLESDETIASRSAGCFSASCDRDMEELSCVQSATTGAFYQCKDGKWYRGNATSGPFAACSSSHAIGQCD